MTFFLWGGNDSAITQIYGQTLFGQATANQTSVSQVVFAENVELTVDDSYQKFLYMTTGTPFGQRAHYSPTDRNVQMQVGRLFAGMELLNAMTANVNLSAVAHYDAPADGVPTEFVLYSARIPHYQAVGREGQIWRDNVTVIAPDISGLA